MTAIRINIWSEQLCFRINYDVRPNHSQISKTINYRLNTNNLLGFYQYRKLQNIPNILFYTDQLIKSIKKLSLSHNYQKFVMMLRNECLCLALFTLGSHNYLALIYLKITLIDYQYQLYPEQKSTQIQKGTPSPFFGFVYISSHNFLTFES